MSVLKDNRGNHTHLAALLRLLLLSAIGVLARLLRLAAGGAVGYARHLSSEE